MHWGQRIPLLRPPYPGYILSDTSHLQQLGAKHALPSPASRLPQAAPPSIVCRLAGQRDITTP